MLKILYFAGLRESVGCSSEEIALPHGVSTVGGLKSFLGERHAALLATKNLRMAVNQKMAGPEAAVADGDEVAFFPPVTGG